MELLFFQQLSGHLRVAVCVNESLNENLQVSLFGYEYILKFAPNNPRHPQQNGLVTLIQAYVAQYEMAMKWLEIEATD